jgi:hypothetical protein
MAGWLAGCGANSKPALGPGVTDFLDDSSPFASSEPPRPPAARPCSDEDRAAAVDVWGKLRNVDYPYHLQTVALSPPFRSGCRALIIAEPPPAVTLDSLQAVAPALLGRSETRRHQVGYDGWTQDVVVTLPPVDDAQLKELIAGLHVALFDSTYRMDVLDTGVPPPKYDPKTAPLDVGIGPGDLNRWLVTENAAFGPLQGGEPRPFKDLLQDDEPDVYLDAASGLVVWIVPRSADIARMGRVFRQFTVESDVVVGAVASDKVVAIIARQRLVDPRILPPLRFETASLLAAVNKDSLQQSYDRTHAFAGRIDATRDWAPIFLSPELRDTEYGSVLNIADQFLKSWSNNGTTQYINFKYPSPRRWAFPAPVVHVAKAKSLRYNWNTSNVGAVVKIEGLEVFWLRRTGALNVSYFPDEDDTAEQPAKPSPAVQALEETAYHWFVASQTPILARVVQYNALFQIFTQFKLKSSLHVPTVDNAAGNLHLQTAAAAALNRIRDANDAAIGERLEAAVSAAIKDIGKHLKEHPNQGLQVGRMPHPSRDLGEIAAWLRSTGVAKVRGLKYSLSGLDAMALHELDEVIGTPREVKGIQQRLFPIFRLVTDLGGEFRAFVDPDVYQSYAARVQPRAGTWIHTPSIVISWNEGLGDGVTGGHNLEAKITSLAFDARRPLVAAEQIAAKMPVRTVGSAELDRLVLGQSGPTLAAGPQIRAARAALGVADRPAFWRAPWKPTPRAPVSAGAVSDDVQVARLPDGYRVVTSSGVSREVTTMPEVVELVSGTRGGRTGGASIRFEGFRNDEARVILRAAELRSTGRLAGVLKDVPAFAKRPLDFSRARIFETQVRSFAGGAGEIGIAVELPGLARPSLWFRIKLAFRNATPEWLRTTGAKVRARIDAVLRRFGTQAATARDVGIALRRELKDLLPEADLLELQLREEASDLTIVQREPAESRGANGHAG